MPGDLLPHHLGDGGHGDEHRGRAQVGHKPVAVVLRPAGEGRFGDAVAEPVEAALREQVAQRGGHDHAGGQAAERRNAGAGVIAAQPQAARPHRQVRRSEEHTSELQSLMRISYAVFCLKKKKNKLYHTTKTTSKVKESDTYIQHTKDGSESKDTMKDRQH